MHRAGVREDSRASRARALTRFGEPFTQANVSSDGMENLASSRLLGAYRQGWGAGGGNRGHR